MPKSFLMMRFAALAVVLFVAAPAVAQDIHIYQERGVDSRVDYPSLTQFGPWDDRNYALTQEDLEELRDDEERYRDPIPAFYRVGLRKAENLRGVSTPGYYPLFAVPAFRRTYGGYLVDGQLYRGAKVIDGRFAITSSKPVMSHEEFLAVKAFGGEVLVNTEAAESAIKIHPTNTDLVIAGSNGPNGNEMHFSSDGGATWGETALPLGGTCCDPTVDWDEFGTVAHTATLGNCGFTGCEIWYYRSDDNGQNWTDLEDETPGDPRREVGTGDKEFLHVDKVGASPHTNNVYLSWHDVNVLRIAVSSDNGNTWTTVVHNSDPIGIGSDVVTDRAGTVYHFYPSLEGEGQSRLLLKRSNDGGLTYENGVITVADNENEFNFLIPINDQRGVATIVGADADVTTGPFSNSIYTIWTDLTATDTGTPATNHARIRVAYSRDGGDTWATTTPHPTVDQDTVDRFHPWLAVGPDGTVWAAFYETTPGDREQLNFVYTKSTDGGVTWDPTTPLTGESAGNPDDGFEWGDYNGLDIVGNQLLTIFTDNRDESGGGAATSLDVYVAGLEVDGVNPVIFSDGFEAGNTSVWDISFP
ncbi:MAG: sialidase family protein [Acidobacteriota bacterium]